MTAVTVLEKKEVTGIKSFEVVRCTASDGYTYASKFANIVFAVANDQSRAGSYVSWSGSTVTFHCSSASGDAVELLVIGY